MQLNINKAQMESDRRKEIMSEKEKPKQKTNYRGYYGEL